MRTTALVKSVVLACVVVVAGVTASTAAAATPITAGTWQSFFFGSTGSTATGSPFTFTSSGPAVVTVTDAFCTGDRFTVSDGTTTLGTTSLVAIDPGFPNSCSPHLTTPDAALADPAYSSGRFVVGTGMHSIGVVASTSPFGGGEAFLRYDPFSSDMCKQGGWKAFQPAFKNQGDCVSFVATGGRNAPSG